MKFSWNNAAENIFGYQGSAAALVSGQYFHHKKPQGFADYSQYFFGNDRRAACGLFGQLKGSVDIKDNWLLHIDLMETVNELPVRIESICCTLDELGANCKMIAREVVRLFRSWIMALIINAAGR